MFFPFNFQFVNFFHTDLAHSRASVDSCFTLLLLLLLFSNTFWSKHKKRKKRKDLVLNFPASFHCPKPAGVETMCWKMKEEDRPTFLYVVGLTKQVVEGGRNKCQLQENKV